ncbi:MAG: bcr 1 [Myxococcales bacterium]|nr:bcr 1 [Myxococcales bacterium]
MADVPRAPSIVGSPRWIVTLSAMTAISALSIDLSLPAQPTLATMFDVSAETAQLTLSLFLIGFAAAQIIAGYLSDAWGRRRVMIVGLALFAVAGVACASSPTIEVLLACRMLQGIGAAAAPVVARAMVRDTQPPAQAARLLSTMLAALAVGPMIAPLLGGLLLSALGWRSIFATLALFGVVLYLVARWTLVDTLAPERRTIASPSGLVRGFRKFFMTRGTRLPTLIGCAAYGGQFAFISASPFVLIDGYHVAPGHFGFYFGALAFALMIGSLTGGRMLRAGRSPSAMLVVGTTLLLAGGVLVVIGTHVSGLGLLGFMPPLAIYFFGFGITTPSSTAKAMEPVPDIAGTASAAIGFLWLTSGSISGYVTIRIGGSAPETFAIVMLAMASIAFTLAMVATGLRRRLAR